LISRTEGYLHELPWI